MTDFNQWTGTGRLTRDAELSYTRGGTAILKFSIAVNRGIPPKDQGGEWKEEASFFEVQAWGKIAEWNQNLKKGRAVTVMGSLRQDRWEQDGQSRSRVFIVAERIVETARQERQDSEPRRERQPEPQASDGFTDDIPF